MNYNKMISIVIRNKNEAKALEDILNILTRLYKDDFEEIIIVDNNSTDNSIEVALKFNCKIVNISNFSYGRATNIGIDAAKSQYVLLLSSHAIPVGNNFLKNTIIEIKKNNSLAGIRYINSFENYKRSLQNNFEVREPLDFGLMTACALVNKEVWVNNKFNEELVANEDKEWSQRVVNNGFKILDFNETYFYFIKRNSQASLKRYKIN
jgi:rhamnosyltransferase